MMFRKLTEFNKSISVVVAYAAAALVTVLGMECANAQQMFASGSFDVSPSGAATYSVPIDTGPGLAGVQPSIALTYSSQSGNGYLGWRWSLSGVSGISRCPRTILQDGERGSVNYNAKDRFCLDGQRLILVNGAYGTPGSEYRLEIDQQVKVVAYGAQGDGPLYFKAWFKSGQIIEYGATDASRLQRQGGGVAIAWMQNRVLDRRSNYIDWNYYKNPDLGEIYPTEIRYTGNINANLLPSNWITIGYQPRPDVNSKFVADSRIQYGMRAYLINSYSSGGLIKSYSIQYMPTSPASIDSKIVSIGISTPVATLPPLNFTWSDSSDPAEKSSSNYFNVLDGHAKGDGGVQLVDLFNEGRQVYYTNSADGTHRATRFRWEGAFGIDNYQWKGHGIGSGGTAMVNLYGDGRTAYYTNHKNGDHFSTIVNKDGTAQNCVYSGALAPDGPWQFADLFGDGWPILYAKAANNQHFGYKFFPNCTVQFFLWSGHGVGEFGNLIVDLFGDGRPVYYTRNGTTHYATRFNPDGTSQSWTWTGGIAPAFGNDWRMADIFGDGKQVFYTRNGNTSYATKLNEDNTIKNYSWSGHGVGDAGWELVDLFGDGRKVYWTHNNQGGHFANRLNADQTIDWFQWQGHGVGFKGWKLVDFSGDGRMAYFSADNADAYVTYLNQDGTVQNYTYSNMGGYAKEPNAQMLHGNLYGHGYSAYFTYTSYGAMTSTWFGRQTKRLIRRIETAGTATATAIEYTSIASTNYTKYSDAAANQIDLKIPLQVVARASSSDGRGGMRGVNYNYEGLRAERGAGRGLLGFQKVTSVDEYTGISTQTTFNQTFPFTGTVAKQEKFLGAQRLSLKTNYYVNKPSFTNVFQPTFISGVDQSWDVNGTYISGTWTRIEPTWYDTYGNVLRREVYSVNDTDGGGTGHAQITSSTYTNDPATWILGRLTKSVVQKTTAPVQLPATVGAAALASTINGTPTTSQKAPGVSYANGLKALPTIFGLILD